MRSAICSQIRLRNRNWVRFRVLVGEISSVKQTNPRIFPEEFRPNICEDGGGVLVL